MQPETDPDAKPPAAIIKRARVVLAGGEPKAPLRSNSAPACNGKSVRLLEHEGRVRAIEFTCACGEAALVELVFEEQPAQGKTGAES